MEGLGQRVQDVIGAVTFDYAQRTNRDDDFLQYRLEFATARDNDNVADQLRFDTAQSSLQVVYLAP